LNNLAQIVYRTTSISFQTCTTFLSKNHSPLHEILKTEQQFKRPKSKLFKHLPLTRKNVESLHQLSDSLAGQTNSKVIQQTNNMDAPTTITNDPIHSSTMTEAQSTLILTDGITNDPMKKFLTSTIKPNDTPSGTLSAQPAKLDSNVSRPQHLTNQIEDSQQTPSHSSPTDISESLITQFNCRQHKLDIQTGKRRRHQYRLCYNCRQTIHLKAHCPQTLTCISNPHHTQSSTTSPINTNKQTCESLPTKISNNANKQLEPIIFNTHINKDQRLKTKYVLKTSLSYISFWILDPTFISLQSDPFSIRLTAPSYKKRTYHKRHCVKSFRFTGLQILNQINTDLYFRPSPQCRHIFQEGRVQFTTHLHLRLTNEAKSTRVLIRKGANLGSLQPLLQCKYLNTDDTIHNQPPPTSAKR